MNDRCPEKILGEEFKYDKLVTTRTNFEQVPPTLDYFAKVGGICIV